MYHDIWMFYDKEEMPVSESNTPWKMAGLGCGKGLNTRLVSRSTSTSVLESCQSKEKGGHDIHEGVE